MQMEQLRFKQNDALEPILTGTAVNADGSKPHCLVRNADSEKGASDSSTLANRSRQP